MTTMVTKTLAAVFLLAMLFHGSCVSAETHHVVGEGEKDLDVGSWLSGRVFRVGDKIFFNFGKGEKIVELHGPEELKTCDVSNPIRMYTDDHVVLDKEGTRYFASANLENCKNGLRIPVAVVQSADGFDPIQPFDPPSKFDPPFTPPFEPLPVFAPPPPSSEPSFAVNLKAFTSVLFLGLLLRFVVGL